MRAQIKDWHKIRELEAESKFSEALAHTLQICRVCRRYQLPDGCYGCDLKTKRQQLSEVATT
jgi:hypothetical protein